MPKWVLTILWITTSTLFWYVVSRVGGAWWHGQPLDNAELLGLPLLWIGRIGKALQFAAGLTIVLDLAGKEKLIYLTARADLRALGVPIEEATNLIRLIVGGRRNDILAERNEIPASDYYTLEDYQRIRRTFLKERENHDELAFLVRLVREHLIASPRAKRDRGGSGAQLAWLIFYSVIGFGLVSVLLLNPNSLLVVLVGGSAAIALLYLGGKVWHRIYRSAVRLLAEALVGAEPGNRLRWLAFFLFLNGFFLDFITS